MLADDPPFGDDDDPLGIDRTLTGRLAKDAARCRIAVQMDQARRRHALGVFDEAVERARKLHQIPDSPAQASAIAPGWSRAASGP